MAVDKAFPLDEAEIVSLFVDSVFYGIYLVSFGACMRVMFSGAGVQSRSHRAMLFVAILLAIFGTLNLSLGLRHMLEAFIWYHGPGGPTAEFDKISSWIQVTRNGSYIAQILLYDLVLIYRCFVVYSRSWLVMVLPVIMWIGTLVTGSGVVYVSSQLGSSPNLDEKHLVPLLTSLFVLTVVQNLTTTSFIAYRIWSMDRRMAYFRSSNRGSGLRPIAKLIVESGAIYTVTMIICLIVYLCSSNAQYPVSDASGRIMGIVFNMIIVRVHKSRTAEQEGMIASSGPYGSQPLTFGKSATSRGMFSINHPLRSFGTTETGDHAARRVEVNVTRQGAKDVDNDLDLVFVENPANIEAKR